MTLYMSPFNSSISAGRFGMNNMKTFPYGAPTVGMHVRHGDKSSDGFVDHSLAESIAAMRQSA
eukprot:gene31064-38394_t